jgi:hypothetical protein
MRNSWTRLAAALALGVLSMTPAGARGQKLQGAAGVSVGWLERRDYGEATRANFIPEVVGYTYLSLGHRLFLRPGVRIGYSGLSQPDMPAAVAMREHDVAFSAEAGLVFDATVVPSLSVGTGVVARSVSLTTQAPVAAGDEQLSHWEALPMIYSQLGLGLPMWKGKLLVEPFVRTEWLRGDPRSHWRYGLDITVRVF